MRAGSLDLPPIHREAIHQFIDRLGGVLLRAAGQVRVFGGGQDGAVTEDFLYFEQIDAGLDQMGGIAVRKAVRGNLFFIPQSATTLRRVLCTPPRSSGVVARQAAFKPP